MLMAIEAMGGFEVARGEWRGFPGGSIVMNPPANAGDIRDVGLISGWEDPLEKGMATHSSILAQRIPWTEDPGRL